MTSAPVKNTLHRIYSSKDFAYLKTYGRYMKMTYFVVYPWRRRSISLYRRSSGRRYLSFGLPARPLVLPTDILVPRSSLGTLYRIIAECHLQQRNSQKVRENAHRESPWNAPPNSHDLTIRLSRATLIAECTRAGFFLILPIPNLFPLN